MTVRYREASSTPVPLPLKQQALECSTRVIPVLGQDERELVTTALWKIDPQAPTVAAVSKGFKFAVDEVSKYASSIDMLGGHARIRVGSKPSLDPSFCAEEDKALITSWGKNLKA